MRVVFQEFALFPWRTVEANVAFGLEELGVPAAVLLMDEPPGDVGRQTAWWYRQKLIKTPLAEKDVVDETFLRDALAAKR